MAITSLIMVRLSKFKDWLAAYDLCFAEIQVSSIPKLPESPNSRNFSLAKIKCFTAFRSPIRNSPETSSSWSHGE